MIQITRPPPIWRLLFTALSSCVSAILPAEGEETEKASPDKSGYHLFNPTPQGWMRKLSADRPDKTDSAYTVDAGHFQLEMDFANWTYDRYNPEHQDQRLTAYEAAPFNLKVGLLNSLDFQITFTAYRWERAEDRIAGTVEKRSGFGDVTPRVKYNVIGNDGGPFALALMPFVKLPASRRPLGNGAVEGGLKIPYTFELPGWDLSLQTEVDFNRDEVGPGYHTHWINSVSLGRAIAGKLSGYVEFYSNVSTERGSDWIGTFDTWLTYQINESWRLDGGVYIGLTRAAEDWHPFVGMTWRY